MSKIINVEKRKPEIKAYYYDNTTIEEIKNEWFVYSYKQQVVTSSWKKDLGWFKELEEELIVLLNNNPYEVETMEVPKYSWIVATDNQTVEVLSQTEFNTKYKEA